MKIAIASDHGGYDYKQELIPYIESLGHQVLDLGCHGPASVDYPDYGIPWRPGGGQGGGGPGGGDLRHGDRHFHFCQQGAWHPLLPCAPTR